MLPRASVCSIVGAVFHFINRRADIPDSLWKSIPYIPYRMLFHCVLISEIKLNYIRILEVNVGIICKRSLGMLC
jgi:hypothetical protein